MRFSAAIASLFVVAHAKPQAAVTHKVFFDVSIGGKPAGRIVMGLFGEVEIYHRYQSTIKSASTTRPC